MRANVINMTTSIMMVTHQVRIKNKTVKSNQDYVHLCQYESGDVKILSTLFRIKVLGRKGNEGLRPITVM